MLLPQRVVDYFVLIGRGRDMRSSGRSFHAQVEDRYPKTDHEDAEFPKDVPLFCFPKGMDAVQAETAPKPSIHSFTMTEEDGARVFGVNLTFFEISELPTDEPKTFVPRSMCLTSHWGFYDDLGRFLAFLYDQIKISLETRLSIPIERFIINLIHETPLPPRGRISVHLTFPSIKFVFQRPPPNSLPLFCLDPSILLHCLSLDHILLVFACILTERRVLFISDDISLLNPVIETLAHCLFPFIWRQIYVPVLPKKLVDFICAPMPFLLGIHKSYLPDKPLLEDIILVDLDDNVILTTSETEIPLIPDKPRSKLLKSLRRLTNQDTSSRCPKPFKTDINSLSSCFLHFFAKLMVRYKEYLEAPSDFVIDKFKTQKWVDEHTEPSDFLLKLTETQHFQCFVDERYEASPENLHVLLFDETIDAYQGKTTAFLTDTSNLHSEVHRPVALSQSDLNSTYVYETSWKLDHSLFGTPRKVLKLFDLAEEGEVQRSGLSMKYFADKNLYSRHFHSLKVRSTKQDLVFRQIVEYMEMLSAVAESSSRGISEIYETFKSKDSLNTSTTVDEVWNGLLSFVEEAQKHENTRGVRLKEQVYKKLYYKAHEVEQELAVLFAEANGLDQSASFGKNLADDAKTRFLKHRTRLSKFQSSTKPSEMYLSFPDIQKRIVMESELSNAFLIKSHTEVSFRKTVSVYQQRMPEIIEIVRKLNGERISQSKLYMEDFVKYFKEWLKGLDACVLALEANVGKLDVESDLRTFREGKLEFMEMQEEKQEEHSNEFSVSSIASKDKTVNSPRPARARSILDERGLRFSLDLWGSQGYQIAHSMIIKGKTVTKSFSRGMDDLSTIFDTRSKLVSKSLKSVSPSLGVGRSEDKFWTFFLDAFRKSGRRTKETSTDLKRIAGSLKILKGVLKNTYHISDTHRTRLMEELQHVEDKLERSKDKRDKYLREYEALVERINESKMVLRIEKARGLYRNSESLYQIALRNSQLSHENFDISLGTILDLLQEKELRRSKEIKYNMGKVCEVFSAYLKFWNKQNSDLRTRSDEVNCEEDLKDFVSHLNNASVETETVSLRRDVMHIDESFEERQKVFDRCLILLQCGESLVKQLIGFLNESLSIEESFSKHLVKGSWNHGEVGSSTISKAFSEWEKFVLQFGKCCHQLWTDQKQKVIVPLIEYRTQLKESIGHVIGRYQTLVRDVEPMYQTHTKSLAELEKSKHNLEMSQEKLGKVHIELKKETRRAKLFQKFQVSEEKQAQKVTQWEAKVKEAGDEVFRVSAMLVKSKEMEARRFKEILGMVEDVERKRFEHVKSVIHCLIVCRTDFEVSLMKHLEEFSDVVSHIDSVGDISDFITTNPTGLEPPESVVLDFHRRMGDEQEDDELWTYRVSADDMEQSRGMSYSGRRTSVGHEEDTMGSSVKKRFALKKPIFRKLRISGTKPIHDCDWEERKGEDGNMFYVNVLTGSKQNQVPKSGFKRFPATSELEKVQEEVKSNK